MKRTNENFERKLYKVKVCEKKYTNEKCEKYTKKQQQKKKEERKKANEKYK